jgi:hypothetical protein
MINRNGIRNPPNCQPPQEPKQGFNRRGILGQPGLLSEFDAGLVDNLADISVLIPVGKNRREPVNSVSVNFLGNFEGVVLAGNLGLQCKMGMATEAEPLYLVY